MAWVECTAGHAIGPCVAIASARTRHARMKHQSVGQLARIARHVLKS